MSSLERKWDQKIDAMTKSAEGPKSCPNTKRADVLADAHDLTHGERSDDYGGVLDNHKGIARLWDAYLRSVCRQRGGVEMPFVIGAEDVALMCILLKVQRTTMAEHMKMDHYVDMAAYAGIAGEIAFMERIPF